jgi:chromosome partitioning protein
MIISITSLKGGVGKSSITINLGVCFAETGYKTCILDSDVNGSVLYWSENRGEQHKKIDVFPVNENTILEKIESVNQDYDIILIDGTPSITGIASKLILLADLLLIPIGVSMLDYNASKVFIEEVKKAELKKGKIPTYYIINKFKPNTLIAKEFKSFLETTEIKSLTNSINDRIVYPTSVMDGIGVIESTDVKAKAEFQSLYLEVLKILKNGN